MEKITTWLWFDTEAEEAAAYYTSIFPDSRVLETARYNDAVPERAGQVLTVSFEVNGMPLVALNGGPEFRFTEAISFQVLCEDQAEVDHYWDTLVEGGEESQCGWLKDRYGLSWQIVPKRLNELLADPDPARATAAMQCMLGMKKLDIAELEKAADAAG